MAHDLPLPVLLSQALVAFTIELDNEFEHRMPHRTTGHGSTGGPWLASVAMWWTCMRFAGEPGLTVSGLEKLARTPTNLSGMERWGYIQVAPDPSDRRPKPPKSEWLIRPTPKGRLAQEVWAPLFAEIENRWESRFGAEELRRLRQSLLALIRQIGIELPDCLPILRYGLLSGGPDPERPEQGDVSHLPLPALLSKVLLRFAMSFEHKSHLSLAICANVVRILNGEGVRVRDMPRASGVSKEAISIAMGILQKAELASIESAGRVRIARLTGKGLRAQDAYHQLVSGIVERWRERFTPDLMNALRESLERVTPLSAGLEPYPEGWRASLPRPDTLPHYPMVLHRGGFPDGS